MSEYDDIADGLLHPEHQDRALARATLRYAVQRAIFCPYCEHLLDIRESVVLDGTDHGGRMDILHAAEYDRVITANGSVDALQAKLGYEVQVLDGRVLFA